MKELKVGVWNKAHPGTPSSEKCNRQDTSTTSPQPLHIFIPSLIIFQSFPRLSSIHFDSLYKDPIQETCAS